MHPAEFGKRLQSKETGFLHIGDRIPVLENLLFAYSLCRTRLSDHVLEAKALIEKILAFEVEGNFPCNLHEYPNCLDPYLGYRALPILFWTFIDFSHVIGPLKGELEACIERILAHAPKAPWAEFRRNCFEGKIGQIPTNIYDLGNALLSLQIAEKKGADIEEAVNKITAFWHTLLLLYTGPSLQRHQQRGRPKRFLYDLFMLKWQKLEVKLDEPLILYEPLIRPLKFEPAFALQPIPYVDFNPESETPLWVAFKEKTFVCSKLHTSMRGSADEFEAVYAREIPQDPYELNFFLNYCPTTQILVNNQKSSTFTMKDEVQIMSNELTIRLRFKASGGKFYGHILRGNRPSEHGCVDDDHFTAFDHRISIRTIGREKKASIRVQMSLKMQKQESPQPLPSHASHYPHKE